MIAEVGNHETLMEQKKYYYELIQSQYELDTVEKNKGDGNTDGGNADDTDKADLSG